MKCASLLFCLLVGLSTGLPRVKRQAQEERPGGDGKMKMEVNLKDLEDPDDLTVGNAAMGLMSQAVKAKGPNEGQVNAIAGFGHELMSLVTNIEHEKRS